MSRTIAIISQKGGVGKTNIAFNLSDTLAQKKQRILLVDLDQQGNLSSAFLDNIYNLESTVADIFLDNGTQKTSFENIDIIPSNIDLSKIDLQLAGEPDAQYFLADKLKEEKDDYDYGCGL